MKKLTESEAWKQIARRYAKMFVFPGVIKNEFLCNRIEILCRDEMLITPTLERSMKAKIDKELVKKALPTFGKENTKNWLIRAAFCRKMARACK